MRSQPRIETDDGSPHASVLELPVQLFGFGRGPGQYHWRLWAVVFGHQTGRTGDSKGRAADVHRSTDRFQHRRGDKSGAENPGAVPGDIHDRRFDSPRARAAIQDHRNSAFEALENMLGPGGG